MYGSQFSGEKKRFENPKFGCRDIKQEPSLIFFWDTLYNTQEVVMYKNALGREVQIRFTSHSGSHQS